jgi:hypothetical protein
VSRLFEIELKRRNTSLVDVVIDPDLSGLMRSHQKEGVKVSQTRQLSSES